MQQFWFLLESAAYFKRFEICFFQQITYGQVYVFDFANLLRLTYIVILCVK